MLAKKGFWVAIILLFATTATAIDFKWTLIQDLQGAIETVCAGGRVETKTALEKLPVPIEISVRVGNAHCGKTKTYEFAAVWAYKDGNAVHHATVAHRSRSCNYYYTDWWTGKADEIKVCRDGDGNGAYFILLKNPKREGNVTRSEGKKLLGAASEIAWPKYFETAKIMAESNNQKVKVWADDSKNIYACTDIDEDNNCDSDQAQACASQGGDWNGLWPGTKQSLCCGVEPYKPTKECQYYPDLKSVCGKDAEGKYKWAPAGIPGQTKQLNCPDPIAFLATGQRLSTCKSPESTTTIPISSMPEFEIDNIGKHGFICIQDEAKIYECRGDEPSIAENDLVKESGEYVNKTGEINFCSPQNKWVTDLDTDKNACIAASKKKAYPGIAWTGSKCCGDPNDDDTYEDQWTGEGSIGGCYKNKFIASGDFTDLDKKIINYKGEFYECNPELGEEGTGTATLPDTTLTIKSTGPCGNTMLNATFTGLEHNAVCMPTGQWQLTNVTGRTIIKETKWETTTPQGCCLEDQCWDGTKCRNTGEYYSLEERGYRCE